MIWLWLVIGFIVAALGIHAKSVVMMLAGILLVGFILTAMFRGHK